MSDKYIIVCNEKHVDYYYDGSTPEAIEESALRILTDRFNHWYYNPRNELNEFSLNLRKERDELLALTDEQIDAIPSDAARVELRQKRKQAQRCLRQDIASIAQYERIQSAIEEGDGATAWKLLLERKNHEYERVSLEPLQ